MVVIKCYTELIENKFWAGLTANQPVNYLKHLAATDIAYVGLLGPVGRRERLISELGDEADKLAGRLHGPAGLDIGGRGPAAIALSIAAQLQKVLARD